MPTYSLCSYDIDREEKSICKEIEFDHHDIDAKCYYVYSGYSNYEKKPYSALYSTSSYYAVTNPTLYHNYPLTKL